MKNKQFKTLLLLLFVISLFPNLLVSRYESSNVNIFGFSNDKPLQVSSNYGLSSTDDNNNGISDFLDLKLKSSRENENQLISSDELNALTKDKINFIIQFSENYDYSDTVQIFSKYGGIVKNTYKYAINGFSGSIDYYEFEKFCQELRQLNIPFFIEEDVKVQSNLYYVSRNMNLRPYVWNKLDGGYDGDNSSSIAILDTGIDETHSMFTNGYGDKDFTKKIVGWNDTYNFIPKLNPEDINGHGTHVACIAAGDGVPELDYLSRSVGTTGLDLNFTDAFSEPLPDGYYVIFPLANFNVTNIGTVEIECNYTDYSIDDRMYGGAHLYYGSTEVDSFDFIDQTWEDNLTYSVSTNDLGEYSLEFWWFIIDIDGDGGVLDPSSEFRAVIHYPFAPDEFGSGHVWKGVAPDARIVSVKVLGSSGGGSTSSIVAGINWVIDNKNEYNITIMSMSLGTIDGSSDKLIVDAVNNAVAAGIVTVVAAGNLGSGGDTIGSPGDAEYAITVAAMNYDDQITFYSSQGGLSYYGMTVKPDITAPGGSTNDLTMFSADSNDADVDGAYIIDYFKNDTYSAQGTSMATPAVAGAASLLIEAMGGRLNWHYTKTEALLVKSLLLMTATETVNWREEDTDFTPTLDRGEKDVHEGYGRINIDAAIESWTNNLTDLIVSSKAIQVWLNTSQYNPYGKHAYAGFVELEQGKEYMFNLSVPTGADYDLYLYNYTPYAYGDPYLIIAGITPTKGVDEIFNYTASYTGKYFIVVKSVGDPLPSEDDNNGKDEEEIMTLLEFLMSPVGLLIIGAIAAVVIIMILTFRAMRRSKVDERERIQSIVNKSYS